MLKKILFKKIPEMAANLVTSGGYSELKNAQSEYELKYRKYLEKYNELVKINKFINQKSESIGNEIKDMQLIINQSAKILNYLDTYIDNDLIFTKKLSVSKDKIKTFNTGYSTALRAGFGGLVGGCGAAGAWTLVAFAGTASTGTAISTLSGVAAHNAILAWFGGGALVAGGAGMAGGMMVLGGLIAAPLVILATKGAYKKADKIKKETVKVDAENQKLIDIMPDAKKISEELFDTAKTINQLCYNLRKDLSKLHANLYSLSFFGFFGFKFKRFLGIRMSSKEQDIINEIADVINDFFLNFNLERD